MWIIVLVEELTICLVWALLFTCVEFYVLSHSGVCSRKTLCSFFGQCLFMCGVFLCLCLQIKPYPLIWTVCLCVLCLSSVVKTFYKPPLPPLVCHVSLTCFSSLCFSSLISEQKQVYPTLDVNPQVSDAMCYRWLFWVSIIKHHSTAKFGLSHFCEAAP